MTVEDKDENVLSRWSKRKRQLATEADAAGETDKSETSENTEMREAELLANREAAEAIDLDTITEESDLSLFMKDGVPDALRRKALSVLWRSSPVFANLDGLNDYDENFADPKLIMETFTSAYQVGKGYLKEIVQEDLDDSARKSGETGKTPESPAVSDNPPAGPSIATQENSEQPRVLEEQSSENPIEATEELPKVSLRKRLNLDV